ncbi:MAG: hypothetical protein ACXADY_02925 [Candidatus Hodarchaeales archaeon]
MVGYSKQIWQQKLDNLSERLQQETTAIVENTIMHSLLSSKNGIKKLALTISRGYKDNNFKILAESIEKVREEHDRLPTLLISLIDDTFENNIKRDLTSLWHSLMREIKKGTALIIRARQNEEFKTIIDDPDRAILDLIALSQLMGLNLQILAKFLKIEINKIIEGKIQAELNIITNEIEEIINSIKDIYEPNNYEQMLGSLLQIKQTLNSLPAFFKREIHEIIETQIIDDLRSLKGDLWRKIVDFIGIDRNWEGETPTPFVYYFPYPKDPPAASAKAIPKDKPIHPLEDIDEDVQEPSQDDLDIKTSSEKFEKKHEPDLE